MAYRVDAGRLGKAQRTPQGGMRIPATVAFSTITTYREPDGKLRREWLPPEEAKKKAWLDSLDMAEVTHGHPPERVTPQNRREYSVGHAVAGTSRFDEAENGNVTELAIQDANEIASIERGDSEECSVGYDCKLRKTPGKTPDGREYDAIKYDLIANHVGLRERQWARSRDAKGRGAHLHTDGGDEFVFRLDGDDNQIFPKQRSASMFKFDGRDYDLGNPGDVARLEAAVEKRDQREAAQATELAGAKTALGELQAKHDGLAKDLETAKTELVAAQSRLDGIDVAAAIAEAKTFAPAHDTKTVPNGVDYGKCKSVVEVKAAALAGDPAKRFTVDGRDLAKPEDRAYVLAAFDLRKVEKPGEQRADGLGLLRQAGAPVPAAPVAPTTTATTTTNQDGEPDGFAAYERRKARLATENQNRGAAASAK